MSYRKEKKLLIASEANQKAKVSRTRTSRFWSWMAKVREACDEGRFCISIDFHNYFEVPDAAKKACKEFSEIGYHVEIRKGENPKAAKSSERRWHYVLISWEDEKVKL